MREGEITRRKNDKGEREMKEDWGRVSGMPCKHVWNCQRTNLINKMGRMSLPWAGTVNCKRRKAKRNPNKHEAAGTIAPGKWNCNHGINIGAIRTMTTQRKATRHHSEILSFEKIPLARKILNGCCQPPGVISSRVLSCFALSSVPSGD